MGRTGYGDRLAGGAPGAKASWTGYEGVSQDQWDKMFGKPEEEKPKKPKRKKKKIKAQAQSSK